MMAYMVMMLGLEGSWEGDKSRDYARGMDDLICFVVLVILSVVKVAHAFGNRFCEMFVDEGYCEARLRAEVAFLNGL